MACFPLTVSSALSFSLVIIAIIDLRQRICAVILGIILGVFHQFILGYLEGNYALDSREPVLKGGFNMNVGVKVRGWIMLYCCFPKKAAPRVSFAFF